MPCELILSLNKGTGLHAHIANMHEAIGKECYTHNYFKISSNFYLLSNNITSESG